MPRKLLTILLIASVATLGCINREQFISETGIFNKIEKGKYNDLDISAELEKTTFKTGEDVSMLLILKNNGADLIELDDKGFDAGIYSLDNTLIKYVRAEDDTSKPVNLGAGVSFIERVDWNIDNLEPGKYHLIGYLKAEATYKNSGDKIKPYTVRTKPLTITIE